jgi:hypothetical protein
LGLFELEHFFWRFKLDFIIAHKKVVMDEFDFVEESKKNFGKKRKAIDNPKRKNAKQKLEDLKITPLKGVKRSREEEAKTLKLDENDIISPDIVFVDPGPKRKKVNYIFTL